MSVNLCLQCERPVRLAENFRQPSSSEELEHPYVAAYRPLVATARCEPCGRDVLAIKWREE